MKLLLILSATLLLILGYLFGYTEGIEQKNQYNKSSCKNLNAKYDKRYTSLIGFYHGVKFVAVGITNDELLLKVDGKMNFETYKFLCSDVVEVL